MSWSSPMRRSAASTRRPFIGQQRDGDASVLIAASARQASPTSCTCQLLGGRTRRRTTGIRETQGGAGEAGRRTRGLPAVRAAADADVRLVRPQASRLARALHAARRRCSRSPATGAICASRSTPATSATSSWPASSSARPGQAYNISGQETDRLHRPDPRREGRRRGARTPIVRIPYACLLGAALGLRPVRPRSAVHHQPARGAGHAGRVRGDRLAGHLRRAGDAAADGARARPSGIPPIRRVVLEF